MKPDEEDAVANSVARIYEMLRAQQQELFDLHVAMAALERALRSNRSFAEIHDRAKQDVRTPELVQTHEEAMQLLDSLIRRLKGGPDPLLN